MSLLRHGLKSSLLPETSAISTLSMIRRLSIHIHRSDLRTWVLLLFLSLAAISILSVSVGDIKLPAVALFRYRHRLPNNKQHKWNLLTHEKKGAENVY